MQTKYSSREIKASLPKEKNAMSSLWVRLWVRKASFVVTWLFLRFGWTANKVSIFSWFFALAGGVLLCLDEFIFRFAGCIFLNAWLVLDCVDGNIARTTKHKTLMGEFFDAAAGYGVCIFSAMGIGMAAYHTSYLVPLEDRPYLLHCATVWVMADMCMRLVHQKYLNCYFMAKMILQEPEGIVSDSHPSPNQRDFSYIKKRISSNLGPSGLLMPWLLIALFTNTFDILLIFYTAFYVVSFFTMFFIDCRKAWNFGEESQEKYETILLEGD